MNLTWDMYLDLLENAVDPRITDIVKNVNRIMFQPDDAPPHHALLVQQ